MSAVPSPPEIPMLPDFLDEHGRVSFVDPQRLHCIIDCWQAGDVIHFHAPLDLFPPEQRWSVERGRWVRFSAASQPRYTLLGDGTKQYPVPFQARVLKKIESDALDRALVYSKRVQKQMA